MIASSGSLSFLSGSHEYRQAATDNIVDRLTDLNSSLSTSKFPPAIYENLMARDKLKSKTPVTSSLSLDSSYVTPVHRVFFDDSSSYSQPLPELTQSQLCLEPPEVQRVLFEERLLLEDDQGAWMDEVTVAVEADEDGNEDMLLVYQYSQDEGRLLRVSSRLDHFLATDTELRRIKRIDYTRTLRVTCTQDAYRVFLLTVSGREGWRDKVEYPKSSSSLFILEGANIVLLRKLAISRLFGQFRGQTIDHEGELCDSWYRVGRGDGGDVVVRRVVTSATGQEEMITVLSRSGRIRYHWWSSSDWRLVGAESGTHPGSRESSFGEAEEPGSTEEEVEDEVDTEAYFEKKSELIGLMKKYLLDQPDLQDLIADFLKNLLFEKPEDVVGFADDFFSEFLGIDWSFEEVNDSMSPSLNTLLTDESPLTQEFHVQRMSQSLLSGRNEASNEKSLGSFIRADILNNIIDKL